MASAKDIPPGGEGKIQVKIKTGSSIGYKTQTVTVYSNDPEQSVIKLKISMEIHAILAVQPRSIRFGRMKKGLPYPVKYASLVGSQKDTARIISVTSKNKNLKIETGHFKTGDDKEYQVKITVLPDISLGHFGDQITLETDHKEIKQIKLYVSGEITGNIILTPNHVSFGRFRLGGKYEKSIRLIAAPNIIFKVLDVQTTVPGLHTQHLTLKEGKAYKIKAFIEEDFYEDTLAGKILITTDDKEQQLIEVGVFGRGFKVNNAGNNHSGVKQHN